MEYKVGIKKYTEVNYKDENWVITNDYWTTVEANSERQAKLLAMDNLLPKIAKNEWFTNKNVRMRKHIFIDLSDLVIGE